MLEPELFEDFQPLPKPMRASFPAFPGHHLRVKVAVEDLIFASLGLALVVLAGFCFGIERGKWLVLKQPQREVLGTAAAGEGAGELPGAERLEVTRPAPAIPVSVPAVPQNLGDGTGRKGSYAIQLASYVGVQSAQAEAQRLSRQGIKSQVLKQGRYYELRAVGFSTRYEVEKALQVLRKTYRDAFIKRVGA